MIPGIEFVSLRGSIRRERPNADVDFLLRVKSQREAEMDRRVTETRFHELPEAEPAEAAERVTPGESAPRRAGRPSKYEHLFPVIREMNEHGRNDSEIARALGLAVCVVNETRRRLGLPRRAIQGGQPIQNHKRRRSA